MSLADNMTQLTTDLTAIRNALNEVGIDIARGDALDTWPGKISPNFLHRYTLSGTMNTGGTGVKLAMHFVPTVQIEIFRAGRFIWPDDLSAASGMRFVRRDTVTWWEQMWTLRQIPSPNPVYNEWNWWDLEPPITLNAGTAYLLTWPNVGPNTSPAVRSNQLASQQTSPHFTNVGRITTASNGQIGAVTAGLWGPANFRYRVL